MKPRLINTSFDAVEKEYLHSDGVFSNDNTNMREILRRLSVTERRILILYAELRSVRKVAIIFNCSHSLIHHSIKRIREHIKNNLHVDY